MRKTMTSLAALYLVACLTLPAGALSYTIDAPGNPDYFAEFFEYWTDWNGDEMRMDALEDAAPETYAYFLTLEELGA